MKVALVILVLCFLFALYCSYKIICHIIRMERIFEESERNHQAAAERFREASTVRRETEARLMGMFGRRR